MADRAGRTLTARAKKTPATTPLAITLTTVRALGSMLFLPSVSPHFCSAAACPTDDGRAR
jgi:hypothetical protein